MAFRRAPLPPAAAMFAEAAFVVVTLRPPRNSGKPACSWRAAPPATQDGGWSKDLPRAPVRGHYRRSMGSCYARAMRTTPPQSIGAWSDLCPTLPLPFLTIYEASALPATVSTSDLTPEEQLALFELELKSVDSGHQPC